MTRVFRAFLWMRWRIFVNSLERTGARDTLERFSVAIDKLGTIMAMILLIPSSIALFVLGITAGFGVATGSWVVPMELIRFFLLIGLAMSIAGPIVLPTRDTGNVVRLLLLPIPRSALYVSQAMAALADPWIALMVPVLVGVPIGLAIGLQFVTALIALLAGFVFLLFVLGLTNLAASTLHVLLRDRRRGDIVMLIVILVLPMIGILPQFLMRPDHRDGRRLTRAERDALPPSPVAMAALRLAPYVPSEAYRRSIRDGRVKPASAAFPLAELLLLTAFIQGAALAMFNRVLDMPVSLGTRRAGAFGGLWDRVIPGLSPAASAVAFTQLRLALRSPRGRATIGSPLLMPIILAALAYQGGGSLGRFLSANGNGLALATFGCFAAVLALIPLAMNQFAVDKAGFTRQMLAPLSIRDLLIGKAVGNALIAAGPAVFCFILSGVLLPGGNPALWLAMPLGLVSSYVLLAPAAAALSAIFPKTVDLNSIGTNGNAHQAAGLLGMLSFAAAIAPSALLVWVAVRVLHRADLAPLFLLGWCAVACGIAYLLFIPVRKLVASRVETLAQYY
ncbi:MAG TPA: hypothetical protein VN716_22400 [Vicinamibacterales bacterium]|nr:hypothetical protein [Vicinamibacterales bacterium]